MRMTYKNTFASLVLTFSIAITPTFAFADDASSTPPLDASSTPPTATSTEPTATSSPLSITAPGDQTFSTTTFPAFPLLDFATASDTPDSNPTVSFSPTSFPHGTTTVTWTATDAANNVATTTSNVGVFLGVEGSIDVPPNCIVTDSDGVAHQYPEASSTSTYLGICALEAAKESGLISSVGLSNQFPSLGLFVTSVDGIAADPNSQFWALFQNDGFASAGLSSLPVHATDTIALKLEDFNGNNLGGKVILHINSLVSTSSNATSTSATSTPENPPPPPGGGGGISHLFLNIPNAFAYLTSKQNANGSFGAPGDDPIKTDWAAIACAVPNAPAQPCNKLRAYELAATPTLSVVTDAERHAMALEALNIDPYTGASVNYIATIVNAFDGTSIPGPVQNDIFALFPLLHAGYAPTDDIIQKIGASVLAAQKPDGSWGDPDTTAAAIQGLGMLFTGDPAKDGALGAALGMAEGKLLATEGSDASWDENVDSTSWIQTMMNSVQEGDPAHAIPFTSSAGLVPNDAIARTQATDGGVQPNSVDANTRIWSTSYAIVAASGKSWISLLSMFPKQSVVNNSSGGGNGPGLGAVLGASTSTVATSTEPIATSTPETASSTAAIATSTLTATVATSSATSTPHVVKKKTVLKKLLTTAAVPITTATSIEPIIQTTGASSAAPSGFFNGLWGAIVSFFQHIF